jgi:amino acid transporter
MLPENLGVSKMKRAILLTLLIVAVGITATIIYNVGDYSVSQEYAKTAAQQLNDNTDAYKVMRSQSGVNKLTRTIYWGGFVVLVFALGSVWVSYLKKVEKAANKKKKKSKKKK